MAETSSPTISLRQTPLHQAHLDAGGKMVAFAGYDMPVQYAGGILEEHAWTRNSAGLFDISHMGEAHLVAADGRHETAARALEAMVPADVASMKPAQQRYTQLLNAHGGIIDDMMVTRLGDAADEGRLMLIFNAARKEVDAAHIHAHLGSGVQLETRTGRALLALQGPKAVVALARLAAAAEDLRFMHAAAMQVAGIACHVSRSGYTGEDGFEISLAATDAVHLWQALSAAPEVRPCGLGARDSLRLEAGLCLYGHELDETTSPVEAGLLWSIQKRRRVGGGFPGYARMAREMGAAGPVRVRVGLLPDGRAPAREGTEIQTTMGERIGIVTSGGFSPTLKRPIAMGYVPLKHAAIGTGVNLIVRGNPLSARIVALPFVAHGYRRSA